MLSERQLEALLKLFEERMQGVTGEYLTAMGEHLRDIGKLTATDVHRLTELKRVGANVNRIKRSIAEAANVSVEELDQVFRAVAESNERFAAQWFADGYVPAVKGLPKLSTPIERVLKAQLRITAQEFKNLSQTTVVADAYKKAVDVAVQTVQSGLTDYNSAIRSVLKRAAGQGLRVQYASGLTRRLDTAARQNVLDGVRAINNDVLKQLGKEYGADGVEISAHALCAEDHLPYQGMQFSQKAFDELQNRLDRPFGMWNCKHTIFPIILGITAPAHDPEELAEYRRNSSEQITIDGITKSRYEWTQEQRKIETAVRYQKDVAVAAKASGDMPLRREAQRNINRLMDRYDMITEQAGLRTEYGRMRVAGFRGVKAASADAKESKPFTIDKDGRIIKNVNANSANVKGNAPNASTKASDNSVNFICRIDRNIYSCVAKDITTDEVVITRERIQHIKDRHPNDYERYHSYITQILRSPDYILEDKANTALILKEIKEDDKLFRLVLRLSTSTDNPEYKNSVLTFMETNRKKWKQNIRNKKVLYKRDKT